MRPIGHARFYGPARQAANNIWTERATLTKMQTCPCTAGAKEDHMAKGQMRSSKEKRKPKKNADDKKKK